MIVTIGIAVAVIGVIVWLFLRDGTGATARLRRQLESRLHGDESATAQRLIELERQRRPNASEIELIEAAIRRLERDNR